MSGCPAFSSDGPAGIADALRSVDCLSGQATATAFARLFGPGGGLGVALTLLLTIYVALLAIDLLAGRSRLGLSMLTPRALGLGLALTFATSWVAYQSVVWNLAARAPDQLAGILVGTHGSATALFAHRLDALFGAVASAAEHAQAVQSDATPKAIGLSPADILWLGALLLLLGTIGVLLVTRIALAALLALGPIFIVLALFRGTRGLFEGWLKGVVLFAISPLLAVLIGGGALALVTPVVAGIGDGELDMRASVTVLLGACVYCALMAIVLKVAVTVTAGWRLPGLHDEARGTQAGQGTTPASPAPQTMTAAARQDARTASSDRVREIVAGASMGSPAMHDTPAPASDRHDSTRALSVASHVAAPIGVATPAADVRLRGIGSQFRGSTPARENLPC